MQKFKATREEIMKAYKNIDGYDNTVWILEGELLEGGGTVEKCIACEFEKKDGGIAAKELHTCHNKKEEDWERRFDLNYHDKEKLKTLFAQAIDGKFNRETPKVCPSDHLIKNGNCAVTDGVRTCICKCSFCPVGEEVKLPEIIGWFSPDHIDTTLVLKINEVIRYLASKEKK